MKPVLGLILVSWMNVASSQSTEHEYERTALGDSIDKAALKTLHEAYNLGEDKNIITSPLGIQLLLSLYANGAGPQSQQEIASFLGGDDFKQLTESYSALSREFADMDPEYLTLANKIYVAETYELNDEFNNFARSSYKGEVETLNFGKPTAAAAVINQWAEEKTKGNIKDPVSPDSLTPDTAAALFNVIFFQGHWHVPFEANQTKDEPFHVDEKTTVEKPTMKLWQPLFYTESEALDAQMIELPYKEAGFRMVVVLPNELDGLPGVLEKASQTGLLDDVFKLTPAEKVIDLQIPKFEVKTKLNLNELLPKLGINNIFNEPALGIVKNDSVTVSEAFQDAFVKVDEEGATAGAFTGTVVVPMSGLIPPPLLEFKVDHPFLFAILYKETILFAGTYTH